MKALLLVNRQSRHGKDKLEEAIDYLRESGLEWIEATPKNPGMIANLIRQHQDSVDCVIIGGGDGTLNAAIPGLVETQLPLGILPLGTANDLARTLNIPTTLAEACQIITERKIEQIDVGWVNGKYFFNVASIGLSVQITRKLNKDTKQKWGVFAYPIAAIQALRHSRPFWAELVLDTGEHRRVKTIQIAVGNGRYYGGGMTVASTATIDDQQLDVYSLNLKHWWQLFAILPAMRSGDQTSWSFVDGFSCREVKVQTRRRLPINTDGEITTQAPAHFRVVPQALKVFVPSVESSS
ncbi:lipid kinase [Leptolyngbya sp. FACHB-711]|uniref:lipid kinase n=1 Tax=unclassified Leptolyngbya TaxID=2650499 RepID=UPI001686551F|nr:lipid kinase [Cyanobacteria bacterium FACHB-502]MBD2023203.1 lipid kinase [Leptolyngbya sp. FACHB-711]